MSFTKSEMPKDKGWSWLVMICAFVNIFMCNGILSTYGILLISIEEYYQCTSAKSATIIGTMTITMGIGGAVVLNTLPKYFSLRTMIMIGAVINSMSLIISSMAPNVDFLIFSSGVLGGCGIACIYGPSLVLVGQYFVRHRGFANMVAQTGTNIAHVLLPPLYLVLLQTYDLSGTYFVLGAMVLQCVACGAVMRPASFYTRSSPKDSSEPRRNRLVAAISQALLYLKRKSKNNSREGLIRASTKYVGQYYSFSYDDFSSDDNHHEDADDTGFMLMYILENDDSGVFTPAADITSECDEIDDDTESEDSSQEQNCNDDQPLLPNSDTDSKDTLKQSNKSILTILRNKSAVMLLLSFSLISSGLQSQWTFLPFRTMELGITNEDTAILYSLFGFVTIFFKPLFGLIADKGLIRKEYMVSVCICIVSTSTMCVPLLTTFSHLLIFATVHGIFGGTAGSTSAALLLDEVGIDLFPMAISLDILSRGIFRAITQSFLGWLRDVSGETTSGYFVMSGMELMAMALLLSSVLVKKCRRTSTEMDKP